MARKSMIVKSEREPKFKVRKYTRCKICGRPHAEGGINNDRSNRRYAYKNT